MHQNCSLLAGKPLWDFIESEVNKKKVQLIQLFRRSPLGIFVLNAVVSVNHVPRVHVSILTSNDSNSDHIWK